MYTIIAKIQIFSDWITLIIESYHINVIGARNFMYDAFLRKLKNEIDTYCFGDFFYIEVDDILQFSSIK
jgi:hypothetical protein